MFTNPSLLDLYARATRAEHLARRPHTPGRAELDTGMSLRSLLGKLLVNVHNLWVAKAGTPAPVAVRRPAPRRARR